ncbi:MAG: DinB family protein [Saprospiraceae bacterium]
MREKVLVSYRKYSAKVEALLQQLNKLPQDVLNRSPKQSGWSPLQTAWHLLLVEEISFQYIQKKMHYGGDFFKPGLSTRLKNIMLHISLNLPIKFKAPSRVSGENLPQEGNFDELKERWEKIQSDWIDFFEKVPEELLDKAVYKHPRISKIGWLDMIAFFKAHFKRHLRQINRALR